MLLADNIKAININRRKIMIGSVNGGDAPGLATSMMNQKTAGEEFAVKVIKKEQDIERAEGEAAVKLIEDVAPVVNGRLDTHA